jgi:transposase
LEEESTFATTQTSEVLTALLPDPTALRLVACEVDHAAAQMTLSLTSTQAGPPCPLCTMPAHRLHSYYERTLADVPWAEYRVRLQLRVRKWYCHHPHCRRRIFTERLPTVAAPWARRTLRLTRRLVAVGLALGGKAGVRLSQCWGLTVSRNTLLRLLRREPLPASPTPTVLGVDDWALRKRHTYGTILVDLERRRPIALLSDRDADTLAQWLRTHPGVQIITRDRSKAYEDGARQGAPAAIQVADRFHLVQNLAEVLDQVFNAHIQELNALNDARDQTPIPQPDGALAAPVPPPRNATDAVVQAQQRRAQRLAIYEQVWALHRQGYTGYAIARQLRIGKSTVFRYLRTATFPERQGRSDRGRSLLDPYKPYLLSRWNAGCREALALFAELKGQGYPGSYPTVARYAQRLRQAQGLSARQRFTRKPVPAVSEPETPRLTPRRATWLVLRRPDTRDAREAPVLTALEEQHPALAEAMALAQDFAQLVRQRQPDQLEPWLERATSSLSEAFQRFAKRLREDYDSVKAGVTLPWSNGPVEGHINRLKMLKRQMFGRAKLDLLSRRFLLTPEHAQDQAPCQQKPVEAPTWAAVA